MLRNFAAETNESEAHWGNLSIQTISTVQHSSKLHTGLNWRTGERRKATTVSLKQCPAESSSFCFKLFKTKIWEMKNNWSGLSLCVHEPTPIYMRVCECMCTNIYLAGWGAAKKPNKPRLDSGRNKKLKIMFLPKSIKLQVGLILNTWAKSNTLDHEILEDRKPVKQQQRSRGHGSWQRVGHETSARGGVFIFLPRALERDHIAAGKEQTHSPRGQRWNVALLPLCQRLPHHSSSGDTSRMCVEGRRAEEQAPKMWSSWAKKEMSDSV